MLKIKIGDTVGHLTVVSTAGVSSSHRRRWNCVCDCGQKVIIDSGQIYRGIISCGCQKSEARPVRRNIRVIYNQYRKKSLLRGLDFRLSEEYFAEITSMNCVYCGVEPRQRRQTTLLYNGIDRIDNNVGYIVGNCAPCCVVCNFSKRNLLLKDFRDWIDRIAKIRLRQIEWFKLTYPKVIKILLDEGFIIKEG